MKRRVLLLEPDYKNKYPPQNLMKLATYFRSVCKDDVRFYKGDLRIFAAQLLVEEFYNSEIDNKVLFAPEKNEAAQKFGRHEKILIDYIKSGKVALLEVLREDNPYYEETLRRLHRRFKLKDFPKFDIICVNSLFTFFFNETIRTINAAKNFLAADGKFFVGGVAATLVPKYFEEATGILPHIGLLDKPDDLGKSDDVIIDTLPPDYSILDEIDYKYPAADSYITYTTRGCIRNCSFCAVTRLEPEYKDHVPILPQIKYTDEHFGAKKNLLLMDNNVLASKKFDEVIDEIKACGFGKGATYRPPDEYALTLKNLRAGFNDRAYIKKMIGLYDELATKLPEDEAAEFFSKREENFLLAVASADAEKIFAFDEYVCPLFKKYFRNKTIARFVDFNQGLDARLLDDYKMARLAELNLKPMRIAFDHIEQRDIYERAIRLAVKYGVKDLSNYLLYNFLDTPEDFYNRLRINIDLSEELDVSIYSFPMKYCPIDDPKYFSNRDFIGRHWNRKFIRSVQAIINATKGKVGRGRKFFEKAFGEDIAGFYDLLYMPETFIIFRFKYEDNLTAAWREKFLSLTDADRKEAKKFIEANQFSDEDIAAASENVREVLKFYQVGR